MLKLSYTLIVLLMFFSFWFYIVDGHPSSSSGLKVKMVRGESEVQLLEPPIRKEASWENATAFIGNQPGGYKVSKTSSMISQFKVRLHFLNTF